MLCCHSPCVPTRVQERVAKDEGYDSVGDQSPRGTPDIPSTDGGNGQREVCLCGTNLSVVKGLCVITADIVAAAQRNKRKVHADFVSTVIDVDGVKKVLLEAQDKVVDLRSKHLDMQRHHRHAEENHIKAADINKTATIQLNDAISSGMEKNSLQNLEAMADLSHAVLRSSTTELERVTRKLRFAASSLQTARNAAEEHVREYEHLLRQRDRASAPLELEDRVMDAVTSFMQKESDVKN